VSDVTWTNVVPNDPDIFLPNGPSTGMAFTVVRQLKTISIDVGIATEETAYRDGAWQRGYSTSTYDSGTKSGVLRRDEGWIQSPQVAVLVEPASTEDPEHLAPAATLTPAMFGVLAQWPLVGKSFPTLRERIAGRHLTINSIGKIVPDHVPNLVAPKTPNFTRVGDAGLQLVGEMTIALRAWWDNEPDNSYTVLVQFGAAGSAESQNVLYTLYVESSGRVSYFVEKDTGVPIAWTSNLYVAPGRWQFYCLRRAANGVVTLDLDDFSETSGALAPPTGGTSGILCIGTDTASGSPPRFWYGGMADINLWDFRLNNSEVALVRRPMMAPPPARTYAYASVLYAPWAQWALDTTDVLNDRSGNGRHLASINNPSAETVPSRVPGKRAFRDTYMTGTVAPNLCREMTVVARLFLEDGVPVNNTWVLINANTGSSYTTPLQVDVNRRLSFYNEGSGGPGTGVFVASQLVIPIGRWVVVAARRQADGIMILNVDDEQYTTDVARQPAGNTPGSILINRNSFGDKNDGCLEDVNVWEVCLSDVELLAVRTSMGMV
jgi:hypothetical protein